MPRNIYDEDHEAFRASAREFVERTLAPRAEEMIRDHVIARDWIGERPDAELTILQTGAEIAGMDVDQVLWGLVEQAEMGAPRQFTHGVDSCFAKLLLHQ